MTHGSIAAPQPLIDRRGAGTTDPQRARLLQALEAQGSISAAARKVGMSYKGALAHADVRGCFTLAVPSVARAAISARNLGPNCSATADAVRAAGR